MDTILDRRLQSIGLSFIPPSVGRGPIDEYASFAKGKHDDSFPLSEFVDPPFESNVHQSKNRPRTSSSHSQHSGKDPLTMVHEMVVPLSPLLSPLLIHQSMESPGHSSKKRRVEENSTDRKHRDEEKERRSPSPERERRKEKRREEREKEKEKEKRKEKSSSKHSKDDKEESKSKSKSSSSSSSKKDDVSPTTPFSSENVTEITQEATKLKRLADKETDRKQAALYYVQSGLKFLRAAFIQEKRKEIKAADKMYMETAAFFEGISKNSVESSHHLASICYQCMGVAMMRRFIIGEKARSMKDDLHLLEAKIQSQNNLTPNQQSSQTPSPFPQANSPLNSNNVSSPSLQQNGKETNGTANTPPSTNLLINLKPNFTRDVADMLKVFDALARAEHYSKISKSLSGKETTTTFGTVFIPTFIEGVLKDLHQEES